MMLFFVLMQTALAANVCKPDGEGIWEKDRFQLRFETVGEEGHPPCRVIDLGSVLDWRLRTAKVVVREWDDSRHVFGAERVFQDGSRWLLYLPENRSDDRVTVEVHGDAVDVSDMWKESPVVVSRTSRSMDVEWRAEGAPLFGPDGTVSRVVKMSFDEEAVLGVHQQWWPLGVVDTNCKAWIDGTSALPDHNEFGCSIRVDGGNVVKWSLSWTEPHASSSDEWLLESGDTIRLRGAEFISTGVDPTGGQDGLQFQGPGRVSVRVNKIEGALIENNALDEVEYAAKAVSIPEPGVGLEFKGHVGDVDTLSVVLEKLRSQVVTGTLPGAHPLKPRKLTAVRKSRWASPWEQALMLSRYLEQLKFNSQPFPVRPAMMGPPLEGAPLGYTGAVVRVQTADEVLWLDPSCAVCAVGEITPSLWGGTLFDAQSTQLPKAEAGTMSIRHQGEFVDVSLAGLPALELRRWLTQFTVKSRPAKIAERFGGKGASLVSHQGLVELGQPIELRIAAQSLK